MMIAMILAIAINFKYVGIKLQAIKHVHSNNIIPNTSSTHPAHIIIITLHF